MNAIQRGIVVAEEQQQEQVKIGNYDLIGVIATGSSCQIWEARQGEQMWAIKSLLPEKLPEAEERNSLKHEAKVLQSLQHPGFVQYRESTISKKEAYLVMEYFRAPNLKQMVKTARVAVHSQFARLLEQVCLALGYMHEQGWVHRDIKPDNILFSKSGELKLIDFSLSTKFKTGFSAMVSGKARAIQGTRTYIAPETIMKKQPTPQTDMYSLGVTLYEAITGRLPFAGASPNQLLVKHVMEKPNPPSSHNPNVLPDLDAYVMRLLKKKPADRFRDMNEAYMEVRTLKMFREDPAEMERQREAQIKKDSVTAYETVLDSRLDAERTAQGIKLPPKAKKKVPVPPPESTKKSMSPAPPQPVAQPMPAGYGYPPGYYPPMPGQPYPQAPYPYPPQAGYPQWQMPPGQAHPGQMPPSQTPPNQMPPGQGQPQAPPAQSAPPTQPTTVAPAPQAPPTPPQPKSAPPKDDDDKDDELPFMDELPEVI